MILQPTIQVDTSEITQEHITIVLLNDMCLAAIPGEAQKYLRNVVLRNRDCKTFVIVVDPGDLYDMAKRFAEALQEREVILGHLVEGKFVRT